MHPFTRLQYETFRAHGHRYEEFARRFETYATAMENPILVPEFDRHDLREEIRSVYHWVPMYMNMRAYRDAVWCLDGGGDHHHNQNVYK